MVDRSVHLPLVPCLDFRFVSVISTPLFVAILDFSQTPKNWHMLLLLGGSDWTGKAEPGKQPTIKVDLHLQYSMPVRLEKGMAEVQRLLNNVRVAHAVLLVGIRRD